MGYSYPDGDDFPAANATGSYKGAVVGTKDAQLSNDEAVSRFAFAKAMRHRTQSTSTASSSSLETKQNTDWWEKNSPWALQWDDADSQKVSGEPVIRGATIEKRWW